MLNSRLAAVETASKHMFNETTEVNSERAIHIFNKNVFSISKMRDYLSKSTFSELKSSIDEGKQISRELAD